MGITAENLAEKYEVSREAQDEVAVRSQERAAAAIAAGKFKDEIVPVEVKQGKETVTIDTDEHPRHDHAWKRSPSSSPPSRRAAWSRPATPAASTTAPPPSS